MFKRETLSFRGSPSLSLGLEWFLQRNGLIRKNDMRGTNCGWCKHRTPGPWWPPHGFSISWTWRQKPSVSHLVSDLCWDRQKLCMYLLKCIYSDFCLSFCYISVHRAETLHKATFLQMGCFQAGLTSLCVRIWGSEFFSIHFLKSSFSRLGRNMTFTNDCTLTCWTRIT